MEASSSGKKGVALVLLVLLVSFNLGCLDNNGFGDTAVSLIAADLDISYDEVIQINLTKIETELEGEYEIIIYDELEWDNGFVARALDHANETNDAMYFTVYAESENGTNKSAKYEIYYWHPLKNGHYVEFEDEETIEEIEDELRTRAKHIAEVASITVDVDDFFFIPSPTD